MKRVSMRLVPLVVIAITLFTTGVSTVQASVETGWPAGTPNTCRNPDDFFLNFETGIDEIEIKSTIPGMQFTTTGNLNWKYGVSLSVEPKRPLRHGRGKSRYAAA